MTSSGDQRGRVLLSLCQLLFAAAVVLATSATPESWVPSLYQMGGSLVWLVFAGFVLSAIVGLSTVNSLTARLIVAIQLGGLLLIWPTLLTGRLYGADSPNTIRTILQATESGHLQTGFYHGLTSLGSIIYIILDRQTAGIFLLLIPIAGTAAVGAWAVFQRSSRSGRTMVLTGTVLMPIGIGLWTQNVAGSIHPFYIGLPLGILVIVLGPTAVTSRRRRALLIVLLAATGLFHPFLFVIAALLFLIRSVETPRGRNYPPSVGGWSAIRRPTIIILPAAVMVFFFQVLHGGQFLAHLHTLGILFLSFGDLSTTAALECRPNEASPYELCSSWVTVVALSLPVVAGGLGGIGIVHAGLRRLLRYRSTDRFDVSDLSIFGLLTISAGIGMLLAIGVIQRAILLRAAAPIGLVLIFSAAKLAPHRRTLMGGLLVVLLVTPAVLYAAPHTGTVNVYIDGETESQARWILSTTDSDALYATGRWGERPTAVINPSRDPNPFIGAQWRYKQAVIPPGGEQVVSGTAMVGQPTPDRKADFIIYREIDAAYLPGTYKLDGIFYQTIFTMSERNISTHWGNSSKIHTTGDGTSIHWNDK